MKKILSLLAIIMLMAVCPQMTWADDVQWTDVSTAQQFYNAINNNHSANIKLKANIDLSGLSGSEGFIFQFTFSGRIESDNDKSIKQLKNLKYGLFKEIKNASFKYIGFTDCSYTTDFEDELIETWAAYNSKSGIIAGSAISSTIEGCSFSCVKGVSDHDDYDCSYMGIVVGSAESCTFSSLLFAACSLDSDGSYVGCVAGYAKDCTFHLCITNLRCSLWADGDVIRGNSAYLGGLCGNASNCQFDECVNMATVISNDDRVGGIVGYANGGTTLTDCRNMGVVKHCKKVDALGDFVNSIIPTSERAIAGIIGGSILIIGFGYEFFEATYGVYGFVEGLKELFEDFCTLIPGGATGLAIAGGVIAGVVISVVAALAIYRYTALPDELGGIAGTLAGGCKVLRCVNSGPVECRDCYGGGIVGKLEGSTIESCYNQSFVKGSEKIGGIVGYVSDGTVKNSLSIGAASDSKAGRGGIDGGREGTCTCENNYYLSDVNSVAGGSTAFTQEKLVSGEIAKTMNDNLAAQGSAKIWQQTLGEDFYPTFDSKEKTIVESTISNYSLWQKISNSNDFFLAAANPNAMMDIQNDIDLANYYFNLGSTNHPFKGTIKGNGHKLSNVKYTSYETEAEKDNDKSNNALFPVVSHATFENLTLDNIKINQMDELWGSVHTEAILAATSDHSSFTNITIKNCSILKNSADDYLSEIGGIVAISNSDTFTDCTVESSCKFQGFSGWKNTDTNVGGIVSKAYNTTITRCHNAAKIWADDNQEGGIAAYAENCTIQNCLNTGGITAQENVGGICGNAVNTVITHCVNTGWIDDDDNTREDKRSGIVGVLNGSNAIVSYCMNFGSVNYADDDCSPINNKRINNAKYGEGNIYYCQFNGKHIDNTEDASNATYCPYSKIVSGEYACNHNDWLYQHIDGTSSFSTNYPVPIPAAGTVYLNVQSDGTPSYSNIYQSAGEHTCTPDNSGKCQQCGKFLGTAPANVQITGPEELNAFAKNVNNGIDFSQSVVSLDNDIDMSGYTFTPIGSDDHPFSGTFDGQGHRVKNFNISSTTNRLGFFGTLSGANTVIKNVIIDSSCSVTSTAAGIAGLAGGVRSSSATTCNVTIENCGNEANITGDSDVGGILGGVYINDNTVLEIGNSYNAGSVSGSKAAALCGFARKNYTFTNCYNVGSLTGVVESRYLYRYTEGGTSSVTNCYDVNGSQTGVTQVISDQVRVGSLCQTLNTNRSSHTDWAAWTQDIGTDSYPTFGNAGIHYSRTMTNQWGTICLPFAIEATGDDYDLYTIESTSANTLNLKKLDGTLAAGKPALIRRNESATGIDIPANTSNTDFVTSPVAGDNSLTGTFTDTPLTSGYIIANNSFWDVNYLKTNVTNATSVKCSAYHAYIAGISGAKELTIGFDDATAVNSVNTEQLTVNNGKYIENGRVVILKNNRKYNLNGQEIK